MLTVILSIINFVSGSAFQGIVKAVTGVIGKISSDQATEFTAAAGAERLALKLGDPRLLGLCARAGGGMRALFVNIGDQALRLVLPRSLRAGWMIEAQPDNPVATVLAGLVTGVGLRSAYEAWMVAADFMGCDA